MRIFANKRNLSFEPPPPGQSRTHLFRDARTIAETNESAPSAVGLWQLTAVCGHVLWDEVAVSSLFESAFILSLRWSCSSRFSPLLKFVNIYY